MGTPKKRVIISQADIKRAFKVGFEFGKQEQYEEDNPNVGYLLSRTWEFYWRKYISKEGK